jgi:exo-beta-1,3-glucanase (GH17 family)
MDNNLIRLSVDDARSLHQRTPDLKTKPLLGRQFAAPSRRAAGFATRALLITLLTVQLAGLVATLVWWWFQGQPKQLQMLSGTDSVSAPCVSYAPFRRPGASPFIAGFQVAKTEIEEDLRIIKKISSCVRTYGISAGLDQVPQVARELGMKVRLGAWIGKDPIENQRELLAAIALTKTHSDVIETLIVGNEVLLRKDLRVDELAALLVQAKASNAVPNTVSITYADVWEFWRSNPQLAALVDTIAIHVLPYWEDEPVAAPLAVEHVFSTYAAMQKVFAPKRVWIAETGWPAAGRQRRGAKPDGITQIQFVREVVQRARVEKIDVNVIEAFDQPWKRALEGAMGGAWGLFDANGGNRYLLTGSFTADPQWWRGFLGAILGSAVGTAVGLAAGMAFFKRTPFLTYCIILCIAIIGALLPAQIDFINLWSRTTQEFLLATYPVVLAVLGSLAVIGLSTMTLTKPIRRWLEIFWVLLLFSSATTAIVLLVDPRYRGFPIAGYFLPALLSLGLLFYQTALGKGQNKNVLDLLYGRQLRFLSAILAIASIAVLIQEQIENTDAVVLCVYWLLIAAPLIVQSPAKSNATAPTSGA